MANMLGNDSGEHQPPSPSILVNAPGRAQTNQCNSVVPGNSIARWILLRLGLLLFVVGTAFFTISSYILMQRFDAFEQSQYTQDAARVAAVLEQDRQNLISFNNDYGWWDESYQFIKDREPGYIDRNFTMETLSNFKASAVVLFDLNYQPALALEIRDGTLQTMMDARIEQLRALLTQPNLPKVLSNSTFYTWWDKLPYLIAVTKVINTKRDKPAIGHLIWVRTLDESYLKHISTQTDVLFSLHQTGIDISADRVNHHSSKWMVVKSLTGLKNDLSASPLNILVEGPGRLNKERFVANITVAVNILVLLCFSLWCIRAILNRQILKRLSLFSELADRRHALNDNDVRWPVYGSDELDNLARSLNELMDEVGRHHGHLNHLADHDSLTNLGNRRQLMARLDSALNLVRQQPHLISYLLLLDLDTFKLINDGLGHSAGDWVLQEVARRVRGLIRKSDTLVRLGGDEFAILLLEVNAFEAQQFADRVSTALNEPARYEDRQLSIRASIGIAQLLHNSEAEEVLRNADLAMYEAKRRGKQRSVIFDDTLLTLASRRLRLEQALQNALKENALDVWFQPIMDAVENRMVGMEALLRWSLEGSFIPPDEFIKIAENNGLITQMGRFVLERTCMALKALLPVYPHLTCSINISLRQFTDVDLNEEIMACLREYNLPASALHLELTESMVAQNECNIVPVMRNLVNQGIEFHLDDFGTGYSSLDRLRKLPLHTLKIDRSFVTPLREGDDVMVRSIIRLAQELGMNIIAEGVEEQSELDHLLKLGCVYIQGYYFARPMPFLRLLEWLKQR